jgi:hypothetical protein
LGLVSFIFQLNGVTIMGIINKLKAVVRKARDVVDGTFAKITAGVGLAVASFGASAAGELDTAITSLVTGVIGGVTSVVTQIVPLLVLVFGFAFAIRWVAGAIKK